MGVLLTRCALKCSESNRRMQADSRCGNVRLHRQGTATRQARARRRSTSVLVDCPGKGALPAIGDLGPINGLALTHCAMVGSD